ncbi:MAG: hypothetical protein JSW39_01495 [Desulfobacterales bacterium]|nr:MAG: hypothetical protein JSW39_01495 [Desulfobacterales bacterium]
MQLFMNPKFKRPAGVFLGALLFLTLIFACSGGDEQQRSESATIPAETETFTFFDLGANTVLSDRIRENLQSKLGRDAVEHRSIIDLEINYKGFLKKYFPALHELNQKLNFPAGERVEHNTVKLMYRYARKKNIPFDYVELVFSDYTQAPLFFAINFRKDDSNIMETLKTKHGQPGVINWEAGETNGQSLYWQKSKDTLIVSLVPDQLGRPRYVITIYFGANLEDLLTTEKKAQEAKRKERARSGQTAF